MAPGAAANARHRGEKLARVGSLRLGENVGSLAFLDHAAVAHDDDAVRHLGDHAHVVGDQDDAGALLALQVAQQFQHLALHGDVERRRRLVGDQHVRPQCQRNGDHHALAHAAGELVRKLLQPALGFRDAHRLQRLDGALTRFAARHAGMRLDRTRSTASRSIAPD